MEKIKKRMSVEEVCGNGGRLDGWLKGEEKENLGRRKERIK